ncbi:MAG TPA: MerR family transcriptional regulator [Methylovirgula sp.]|nr:MerR family transcriptional regulator [Methylovirgula sp.]
MEKTADAFRTISEVAQDLDLPQHVLRFWETRFVQIKPLKRGGGRRYYRREDIDLLRAIRQLLYGEGYTIKGVQKILKEQGARGVIAAWRREAADAPTAAAPLYDMLRGGHAAAEAGSQGHSGKARDEIGQGGEALGPAEYQVLEKLLTELGECERLLGAARAS